MVNRVWSPPIWNTEPEGPPGFQAVLQVCEAHLACTVQRGWLRNCCIDHLGGILRTFYIRPSLLSNLTSQSLWHEYAEDMTPRRRRQTTDLVVITWEQFPVSPRIFPVPRPPTTSHPLGFAQRLTVNFYCCSIDRSCPILCNPKDSSTPGFPVLHYLLEFAQTQVH